MRVDIVVVVRSPKEGPNNRRSLYPTERQLQCSDHLLIRVLRKRQDLGRKGILVLGIGLYSAQALAYTACRQLAPAYCARCKSKLTSIEYHSAASSPSVNPAAQTHPTSTISNPSPPAQPPRKHKHGTHPTMQEILKLIRRERVLLARIIKRILRYPYISLCAEWPRGRPRLPSS